MASDVFEFFSGHAVFGVVCFHEVEDDADQSGLGDFLAVGAEFVFGDGWPDDLTLVEVAGGGEVAGDHVDEAAHHRDACTITGELWKFVGEVGEQSSFEGFVRLWFVVFGQVILLPFHGFLPAFLDFRLGELAPFFASVAAKCVAPTKSISAQRRANSGLGAYSWYRSR
jgi:hypothetical protein